MDHRSSCSAGLKITWITIFLIINSIWPESKVVSKTGERNSFIVEKPLSSKPQNRQLVDYSLDLCIAGIDRLRRKIFKAFKNICRLFALNPWKSDLKITVTGLDDTIVQYTSCTEKPGYAKLTEPITNLTLTVPSVGKVTTVKARVLKFRRSKSWSRLLAFDSEVIIRLANTPKVKLNW